MKKIEIDSFVKAFEESGLKPMQGNLFPQEGCACALGAYAYVNGHKKDGEALHFLNNITSVNYVNSFGFGFDGLELPPYSAIYESSNSLEAYKDGMAAWEAVKHLV